MRDTFLYHAYALMNTICSMHCINRAMKCDAIQCHQNVPFEYNMKCEHLFVSATSWIVIFVGWYSFTFSALVLRNVRRDKNIELTKIIRIFLSAEREREILCGGKWRVVSHRFSVDHFSADPNCLRSVKFKCIEGFRFLGIKWTD